MKRILITGASGFIGSFLTEKALEKGFETWAAVRKNSSRKYLSDSRIHFIELDFSNTEKLKDSLKDVQFDYVVHAAGTTKAVDKADFFRVNARGTAFLADALVNTQEHLQRLVFISSLSVMGAIHEQQPYTEIADSDQPQPNTYYGKSKLQAENYLEEARQKALIKGKDLKYIVLRPTGVYGPREKDYMMMVDSIKKHVDFAVGLKPQDITFIYVRDLVKAVFLSLEGGVVGKKYFLSDGNVYQSKTFSQLIRKQLGIGFCMRMVAPLWLLRIVTTIGDCQARMTGKITALNNDKYHILKQRNWRCDISAARSELGYDADYDLARGVEEMLNFQS